MLLTCCSPEEDAQLEIFLVNGKSVTVDILSTDQTDDVLESVGRAVYWCHGCEFLRHLLGHSAAAPLLWCAAVVQLTYTRSTPDPNRPQVIQLIGMDPDLTYYFALYLVEDATGKVTIRRLQDFESPFISLRRASAENKVGVLCSVPFTTGVLLLK